MLNRGVGRMTLFDDEKDYLAFERVLAQAVERLPQTRLLGYCVVPNHWHLVLWPKLGHDDALSEFMRWLTVTHTQRWHAHRHSAGTGPVYQGRYKSFPVASDEHFVTVMRYVERNALRAGLVEAAEDWRFGSLWRWTNRNKASEDGHPLPALSDWPVARPRSWARRVNEAIREVELEAVRRSVTRGSPFGREGWAEQTAAKLGLESTLRPRGRPRKRANEDGSNK